MVYTCIEYSSILDVWPVYLAWEYLLHVCIASYIFHTNNDYKTCILSFNSHQYRPWLRQRVWYIPEVPYLLTVRLSQLFIDYFHGIPICMCSWLMNAGLFCIVYAKMAEIGSLFDSLCMFVEARLSGTYMLSILVRDGVLLRASEVLTLAASSRMLESCICMGHACGCATMPHAAVSSSRPKRESYIGNNWTPTHGDQLIEAADGPGVTRSILDNGKHAEILAMPAG